MKTIRNFHFWAILIIFIIISLLQYVELIGWSGTSLPSLHWGLTRHSFDRFLLLIPILYANWIFGIAAGISVTVAALMASLPRIIFISPAKLDSILELLVIVIIGLSVCFLLWLRSRETARADKLAKELNETRRILQINLDALTISEGRLSILNTISSTLYKSLELEGVFQKAVRLVSELMSSEVTLLFIADEKSEEYHIAAYEGVSEEFVQAVGHFKSGEGVYGEVAKTARPMVTESGKNPEQSGADALRKMRIQRQLIVPMVYQYRVRGIICVAMRRPRIFTQEDTDLMTAVGTQIVVAVENSRLYDTQRQTMEELTKSEGKYRRLFERASDAIWANDLSGQVTVANRAAVELMGDTVETMIGADIRQFLDSDGLETARKVRGILLAGLPLQQPYEQKLIRKDRSEVILMVSTSLVKHTDEPPVFEHVARDVTKERRMQDNLRHYVQQITRTQEEERNRIARDLHDDTAQALYVLTRQVDNFLRSNSGIPPETAAFLKGLGEHIRNALQGVRRFSQDLRPPMLDDLGLMATLRWLAGDMELRTHVATKLSIIGTERRLAPHVELAIFRIVQEALRNVEKHASATEVEVNITFTPENISITVIDDGKGFELVGEVGELPREGRLGLVGMEERARLLGGSIAIKSEVNKGTRISIQVPV